MTHLSTYLAQDHAHCDRLFADAENAVAREDWIAAGTFLGVFREATLRHFSVEEAVLFPAFEATAGARGGPTAVMRQEHEQMRDVLAAMAEALGRCDRPGFLGLAETLLVLLAQHNLKEEQILYPMCDHALVASADALLAEMQSPAG